MMKSQCSVIIWGLLAGLLFIVCVSIVCRCGLCYIKQIIGQCCIMMNSTSVVCCCFFLFVSIVHLKQPQHGSWAQDHVAHEMIREIMAWLLMVHDNHMLCIAMMEEWTSCRSCYKEWTSVCWWNVLLLLVVCECCVLIMLLQGHMMEWFIIMRSCCTLSNWIHSIC